MRKNSLIKVLGVTLAATLAFSGCGSSSDSGPVQAQGGTGMAATGGGGGGAGVAATGGTTTGGATTGFGLTGGTMPGSFGGGGGGAAATGTGGTTTTTTGGDTTTGGTTTGTTGGNTFLNAVQRRDVRTGLNNPTAFTFQNISSQSRAILVDGFNLGQSNGRLLALDPNGQSTANGVPILEIQASTNSTESPSLDNPFDVVTDGQNLYVSVGFNTPQDGAIIRISELSETNGVITGRYDSITSQATFPVNPTFMTLVATANGTYVYWSEYSNAQVSGRVRRTLADGSGPVELVMNNLNFPTGIDHDGVNLAICDSGGGGQSLGRMLLAPVFPTTPLNANDPTTVTEVQVESGDAPIRRPFDVVALAGRGFFFTEGASLPGNGAPAPLGPGQGSVRFIRSGSNTAQVVNSGLTNAAGIDALDGNNDGTVGIVFSESIDSTGRILRRSVDTSDVTTEAPSQIESGVFSPLSVSVVSETEPSFFGIINFDGGFNNGVFSLFAP